MTGSEKGKRWSVIHDDDGDFAIFDGNVVVAVTATDTPAEQAVAEALVNSANRAPELVEALRKIVAAKNTADKGRYAALDAAVYEAARLLSSLSGEAGK